MDTINLVGESAQLVPINQPEHLEWLWSLMNTGDLMWLGRFSGETSDHQKFMEKGRSGVHFDALITSVSTGQPAGYVYSYGYQPSDGVVYWGAMIAPELRSTEAWYLEGIALFFDYLFANWNLELVLAETYEYQLEQFSNTAQRWLTEEGRIENFKWWNGRRWAKIFYSLTPDTWAQKRAQATKIAHWLSERGAS